MLLHSGATELRSNLFVDGTRVASTTATLDTGSTCNRTTLMHMLTSGTTAYAKGSIQHAAIWNTALSDSEIMAIQTARNINPTPTPTPTRRQPARRQRRAYRDPNGNTERYRDSHCDTDPPNPTPGSFAAVILATEPANLKGYWKCDETSGTTLADSSGNTKNLTLHGVADQHYSLAQSGEQGQYPILRNDE